MGLYRPTVVIKIGVSVSREGRRRSRRHIAIIVTQSNLGRWFGCGLFRCQAGALFVWTFRPSPEPTQPPINAHRNFFFSRMKSAWDVSLITNIKLAQSLRVSDVIRPFHHMPSRQEQRQILTKEIFLCSNSLVTVINKSRAHETSCVWITTQATKHLIFLKLVRNF